MRAVQLHDGELRLVDRPLPEPLAGEQLLRVRLAGICGTDHELLAGYRHFSGIPGHEFVAEAVADSGQRYVAAINQGCGGCHWCGQGLAVHCPDRRVIGIRDRDGAFAEYLCVSDEQLLAVPASFSDVEAALVEPVAAALQVLEQVNVGPDERVLVVGAGRLAQLIVQVLVAASCMPTVLVRNPRRRAAFAPLGVPCVERAAAGDDYDIVVECSGHAEGLVTAVAALRARGTLVMKSTCAVPVMLDGAAVVVRELRLIGSRCGPMDKAIGFIEAGHLRLEHLVVREFPLAEVAAAFAASREPGVFKVLLRP